jgi:hypothetical protein
MFKIQKMKGKKQSKQQALQKEFIFSVHKVKHPNFYCSLKSKHSAQASKSRKSSDSLSISNPSTHKTPPPPQNRPKKAKIPSKQSNSASKTSHRTPNLSQSTPIPSKPPTSHHSSSSSSSSSPSRKSPKPPSREQKKILYYAQLFERQQKREENNKKRKLAKQTKAESFKGKLNFKKFRAQKSYSIPGKHGLGIKIEIDPSLRLEQIHMKMFRIQKITRKSKEMSEGSDMEVDVNEDDEEEKQPQYIQIENELECFNKNCYIQQQEMDYDKKGDRLKEDCIFDQPMLLSNMKIPKKVEELKEYEQPKEEKISFIDDPNLSYKERQEMMKEIFISQIMEMTRVKQADEKARLTSLLT